MTLRYLVLAVLCFAFVYSPGAQAENYEQSQANICEAASGCNTQKGCENDVCGPFRMILNYWVDAGKPTINGQRHTEYDGYANCANHPSCAQRAVTGYMRRYAQDCNFDGKIDCDDYARIHHLGGHGCHGELPPLYKTAYFNCRNKHPYAYNGRSSYRLSF